MSNHIVHSYDRELRSLSNSILEMGKLVKEMLIIAHQSIINIGNSYTEVAKATDKKINNYDNEIERQATNMLALRQPMAIDLRQAISALKLAVIMERMGDLAKNITKRMEKLESAVRGDIIDELTLMVDKITFMLDEVLEAFITHNDEKAIEIYDQDDSVDEIYYSIMAKLEEEMLVNTSKIKDNMQIIFAVKNIERIGDYTAKVAKIIHYIVSGNRSVKQKKSDQA